MDADAGLDRVRAAMEREDWPVAIEELGRVKRTGVKNDRVAELSGRVVFQVVRRIRAAVDEGRLDLAQAMISPLTTVAGDQPEVRELTRAIQRLSEAAGCIQQGMMHPAIRILRQLASTLPGASWLETAIRNCRQAAEELETLQGGPLGLIGVQGLVMPESNERSEPPAAAGLALPGRFIIRVDGVGSFLVVRNPRATIGPVSSSARPEVGLVADPGLPTVTIDRMEDDYFLRSDGAGSGKLLADGETIELGPRCRMKFRVPNPASTTAIVALTHARLGQGDLRQIILMDREMVMGPGPAAHIRADELTEPVVLFLRDDRLWCAKKMPVTVDGKETQDPAELAPEKQIQIGPVSLTISAA